MPNALQSTFFFLLSVVLRQALHPYVAWRFQQTIFKNRWLRFWYENMQACAQTNAGTPSTNHCGLYFRPQVPRCFFLLLPKAHISIVRFTCSGAEKCRAVYFRPYLITHTTEVHWPTRFCTGAGSAGKSNKAIVSSRVS